MAGEVDNPAWAAGAVEECLAARAQVERDQRWRMCRSASGRTSSLPKNHASANSNNKYCVLVYYGFYRGVAETAELRRDYALYFSAILGVRSLSRPPSAGRLCGENYKIFFLKQH